MRILLVLPRDNTYHYRGSFVKSIAYAPLTMATLAALVPADLEAEIDIVDEGVEPPRYEGRHYDVVGITCVASSSPRAYALSAYFRRQGAFTALGGAHPTLMTEESATHADAVVVGAGDRSWPQLLRDWRAGRPQRIYRQEPLETIAAPIPRRDLQRRGLYLDTPTVIASMGCGNRCEFCSINRLWDASRRREVDSVIEEIRALRSKDVLFLDPNLTFDKGYASELLRALIPLKIEWAGLAGINVVKDPELFDLVVQSGCNGLLIGFESFSPMSLAHSRKEENDVRAYGEAVAALHARRISVLGTFALGLDGDTRESLLETVENIDRIGLDLVRFSVLTPFPGTPLFDRLRREGRILTEDWFYYDQEHVVFQPEHMRPLELQEILRRVWQRSYSWNRIIGRTFRARRRRATLFSANAGFRYYSRKLAHTGHGQIAEGTTQCSPGVAAR